MFGRLSDIPDYTLLNVTKDGFGIRFDGTAAGHDQVVDILGTAYADILTGNDQDNVIASGGGDDQIKGGDGRDVIRLDPTKDGVLTLVNQATDMKDDLLVIDAKRSALSTALAGDDLEIRVDGERRVLMKDWKVGAAYRHLKIKSNKGGAVLTPLADGSGLFLSGLEYGSATRNQVVDLSTGADNAKVICQWSLPTQYSKNWRFVEVFSRHANGLLYGDSFVL